MAPRYGSRNTLNLHRALRPKSVYRWRMPSWRHQGWRYRKGRRL